MDSLVYPATACKVANRAKNWIAKLQRLAILTLMKIESLNFFYRVFSYWKKYIGGSCITPSFLLALLKLAVSYITLLFYQIEPYFPVFLGINRHPKQKEFLNSCKGFLRAALTGHSHPSPLWKIAKIALFNPCMKF